MTLALLAPAIVLAVLLVLERRERAAERAEWTAERRELLNRIKPETAQVAPTEKPGELMRAIPMDDDRAFWAAHGIDYDPES